MRSLIYLIDTFIQRKKSPLPEMESATIERLTYTVIKKKTPFICSCCAIRN